jgi:hypothetical protein
MKNEENIEEYSIRTEDCKYTLEEQNERYKKQSTSTTRHRGLWGERRCSSYSFLTSAIDGGEWYILYFSLNIIGMIRSRKII